MTEPPEQPCPVVIEWTTRPIAVGDRFADAQGLLDLVARSGHAGPARDRADETWCRRALRYACRFANTRALREADDMPLPVAMALTAPPESRPLAGRRWRGPGPLHVVADEYAACALDPPTGWVVELVGGTPERVLWSLVNAGVVNAHRLDALGGGVQDVVDRGVRFGDEREDWPEV